MPKNNLKPKLQEWLFPRWNFREVRHSPGCIFIGLWMRHRRAMLRDFFTGRVLFPLCVSLGTLSFAALLFFPRGEGSVHSAVHMVETLPQTKHHKITPINYHPDTYLPAVRSWGIQMVEKISHHFVNLFDDWFVTFAPPKFFHGELHNTHHSPHKNVSLEVYRFSFVVVFRSRRKCAWYVILFPSHGFSPPFPLLEVYRVLVESQRSGFIYLESVLSQETGTPRYTHAIA